MMRAALAEARDGHYVFPLLPGSKVPALHGEANCEGDRDCAAGHQGWEQRATRDPTLIRSWWSKAPFNIGIATGPSGLHVLDLDDARGLPAPEPWSGAEHGRDVLALLAERAGQSYPGNTRTVATPPAGEHLYFRAPPGVELRNTVARLGWRIDSRGAGGYIIAPGSRRASGRYRVIRRAPIAPLAEWLIPLLLPPPMPDPPSRHHGPTGLGETRKQSYLDAVTHRVQVAEPGTRHDTLLRAAFTLGRLVAGGDYTDDEARAALRHAAGTLTGFPAREAERTIDDGLRYGGRHPRQLGP